MLITLFNLLVMALANFDVYQHKQYYEQVFKSSDLSKCFLLDTFLCSTKILSPLNIGYQDNLPVLYLRW